MAGDALPAGLGSAVQSILFPTPDASLVDPSLWVTGNLDEYVPAHQAEVMRSVAANRYTAVQSSHAQGKSWLASRLMLWWLKRFQPGDAFVVTTAPTVKQINAILWREFRRAAIKLGDDSPVRITMDASAYMQVGGHEELVAFGRKPADHDPAAFSGIHARNVLVIIDEAGGIGHQMWNAVDTLVTNAGSHVLAIGNPDDPAAHFEEVCRPDSGWNVIRLDALRSPNFTVDEVAKYPAVKKLMEDEGIEPHVIPPPPHIRELLVEPVWVDERIKRWGPDSMIFKAKVRGEFPDVSDEAVISPYLIRKAVERYVEKVSNDGGVAAFDVASTGRDESAGYLIRDGQVKRLYANTGANTMRLAGFIKQFHDENPATTLVVDYVGLGRGVYDALREQRVPIIGFGAGEGSRYKKRYANKRSEGWWTLRGMLERELLGIDPEDDHLKAQLMTPHWDLRSNGQTIIESKADMRKRLSNGKSSDDSFNSPDRADAVMMAAFYYERATRDAVQQPTGKGIIQSAIERMGLRF